MKLFKKKEKPQLDEYQLEFNKLINYDIIKLSDEEYINLIDRVKMFLNKCFYEKNIMWVINILVFFNKIITKEEIIQLIKENISDIILLNHKNPDWYLDMNNFYTQFLIEVEPYIREGLLFRTEHFDKDNIKGKYKVYIFLNENIPNATLNIHFKYERIQKNK